MKNKLCIIFCIAVLSVLSFAGIMSITANAESAYPAWWTSESVVSGSAINDYGAANVGQVKNFYVAAVDHLNTEFSASGGAGTVLNDMAAQFTSGTDANINDYGSVNIGQLKNLTQPIYDRLMALGYYGPPLSTGTASTSGTYPWLQSGHGAVNDYGAANIGQLKYLFSFDP